MFHKKIQKGRMKLSEKKSILFTFCSISFKVGFVCFFLIFVYIPIYVFGLICEPYFYLVSIVYLIVSIYNIIAIVFAWIIIFSYGPSEWDIWLKNKLKK